MKNTKERIGKEKPGTWGGVRKTVTPRMVAIIQMFCLCIILKLTDDELFINTIWS